MPLGRASPADEGCGNPLDSSNAKPVVVPIFGRSLCSPVDGLRLKLNDKRGLEKILALLVMS